MLRILPYPRARTLLGRLARPATSRLTPTRCATAMRRAARVLPGAGCLARALAAECMLTRARTPCDLSIGVRRDTPGGLHAHAWLEAGGMVVTGAAEAADYRSLRTGAER